MNMLINHDSVLSVKLIITSIKTWSTVLGKEVVTIKADSGSYDDQNLQNEEIAITMSDAELYDDKNLQSEGIAITISDTESD